MPNNYFLIVIDEKDQIVEKISVDHNNDKKKLSEAKERYKGKNYTFKLGNIVSEEQFKEVKKLLLNLQQQFPDLLDKVTDKNRPEFRHLGYEIKKRF